MTDIPQASNASTASAAAGETTSRPRSALLFDATGATRWRPRPAVRAGPPRPRLQLLEGFSFEHLARPVHLQPSTQRLLAYLALRGPAHRCLVANALWPEVTERRGLARLRTAMWRLNAILPGVVLTLPSTLSLSRSVDVDSEEQESLATSLLRGRAVDDVCPSLGLASLWPAELLPGWYDDWVLVERERLRTLRLHALELAAGILARQRRLDAALSLALEAVRSDPLRESSHRVVMSVFLEEGNVVDVLRQYELFRDLVGRELGLVPSPAMTRLLRAALPAHAAGGAAGRGHPTRSSGTSSTREPSAAVTPTCCVVR